MSRTLFIVGLAILYLLLGCGRKGAGVEKTFEVNVCSIGEFIEKHNKNTPESQWMSSVKVIHGDSEAPVPVLLKIEGRDQILHCDLITLNENHGISTSVYISTVPAGISESVDSAKSICRLLNVSDEKFTSWFTSKSYKNSLKSSVSDTFTMPCGTKVNIEIHKSFEYLEPWYCTIETHEEK